MLQSKGYYGGYSSAAERLTVAQDVVGSIPTSRPTGFAALGRFNQFPSVRNPPFQVDQSRPWLPSNLTRTKRDPLSNSLVRITTADWGP